MDNEQLLNAIQTLLEGMEKRVNARFAAIDDRLEMYGGILAALTPVVIRLDSRVKKLEG